MLLNSMLGQLRRLSFHMNMNRFFKLSYFPLIFSVYNFNFVSITGDEFFFLLGFQFLRVLQLFSVLLALPLVADKFYICRVFNIYTKSHTHCYWIFLGEGSWILQSEAWLAPDAYKELSHYWLLSQETAFFFSDRPFIYGVQTVLIFRVVSFSAWSRFSGANVMTSAPEILDQHLR